MSPEGAKRLAGHFSIRRRKTLLNAYSLAEDTPGWIGDQPVLEAWAQLQAMLQKPY